MKLFFHDAQSRHRPTQYLVHGKIVEPLERPERPAVMRQSLEGCGLVAAAPESAGLEPILAVHAGHYVDFLASAYDEFRSLPNAGPEVLPNVHPYGTASVGLEPRPEPRTKGILGRTGWYIGDLSCAMMADTFDAALHSADSAVAAARAVMTGEPAAYALCRPPGHHAYADRASGFCFLNNAAIAAQELRKRFERVAILDFDTHHGDGTQAIFYHRDDVFFASTHTDPSNYYPHYFGYADERGAGAGRGCNLNLPLAPGSGDDVYADAVERLADAVSAFGAQALVISAGWDAHRDDPLSRLTVTTAVYETLGVLLAGLALPSVIVQEGGYSLAAVAEAAPAFVTAFRAGHRVA
ncbi:Acetoin utilization deacetylase AcuC [Aureimonas altamirensis DSM 21988]|uniref:Acetoin utilization deacetylase AcuC n=1 Tax=Aureimonas altamirensis DSM 21988 TaxID=1121026 RepID=A0ABY1IMP6_9HYPH|nr:histone deacetylase family protein [Aureimonas altamirensis]SHJ49091.1 Acetoin utilization deacetylase AcuC [Aureimonas altamirensis DSM 21988]